MPSPRRSPPATPAARGRRPRSTSATPPTGPSAATPTDRADRPRPRGLFPAGLRSWYDPVGMGPRSGSSPVLPRRRLPPMKRWLPAGLPALVLLLVPSLAPAETCPSPYVKRLDRPEKYLYLFCVDADAKDNDFVAVID